MTTLTHHAGADADAAEQSAMRQYSKLPLLQAKMEEIEAASQLGDGLKQLEDRVLAMNGKIRKLEKKEEELICLVENTLGQLDVLFAVIDEVRTSRGGVWAGGVHAQPGTLQLGATSCRTCKAAPLTTTTLRFSKAHSQVQRLVGC